MILNKNEAEAVLSVRGTIRKIGGTVNVEIPCVHDPKTKAKVFEYQGGIRVALVHEFDLVEWEDYKNQSEFILAYGLY